MKWELVTFVRVYIMENDDLLEKIFESLKNDNIRGASVFRAINGYGEDGIRTSSFMDLSLNLPLAIEFFDNPEKILQATNNIANFIKPGHLVCWTVQTNR